MLRNESGKAGGEFMRLALYGIALAVGARILVAATGMDGDGDGWPDRMPVTSTVQVEQASASAGGSGGDLRQRFERYRTGDQPAITGTVKEIRRCESSHDYQAKNPRSTASGAWQFIDGTWEWVTGLDAPARAYDKRTQDAAFFALWNGGRGASHWDASRACWG